MITYDILLPIIIIAQLNDKNAHNITTVRFLYKYKDMSKYFTIYQPLRSFLTSCPTNDNSIKLYSIEVYGTIVQKLIMCCQQ